MYKQQAITDLFSLIACISRTMHGHTYVCQDGGDITSGQLGLLFTLKYHGPLTARDIADRLALTPGAVSQNVDVLLARKLITRTARAEDRRTYDLDLSAQGYRQVAEMERKRQGFIDGIASDLTDEELQLLLKAHGKILRYMQQSQNEVKPPDVKGDPK